jgi:hypothetical protein
MLMDEEKKDRVVDTVRAHDKETLQRKIIPGPQNNIGSTSLALVNTNTRV